MYVCNTECFPKAGWLKYACTYVYSFWMQIHMQLTIHLYSMYGHWHLVLSVGRQLQNVDISGFCFFKFYLQCIFCESIQKVFHCSLVCVCVRTQVRIGSNFTVDVGVLRYELNVFIYAIPAAVAGLIILLVLVFSITCCIYVRFKRSNKERDRQFQGLLAQMELMESELAEECRRGGLQLCGCACVYVCLLTWVPYGIHQAACFFN